MSSIIARDFYGDDHPLDRNERALRRLDELERLVAPPEVNDNRYWRRDVDAIGPGPGDLIAAMLALPGCRGLWSFGSTDDTFNLYDVSGAGRNLTNLGASTTWPTIGQDADRHFAYANFASASSQWAGRADEAALDITGALTMICWPRFTTVPASTMGIMSKYGAAGQRGYRLIKLNTSNVLVAQISFDGTAENLVTHTTTVAAGQWYFAAMRFTPSTSLDIWVGSTAAGLVKVTNTSSIPATIFNSSSEFALGRTITANYLNGDLAVAAGLYAAALSDSSIEDIFARYRGMVGI